MGCRLIHVCAANCKYEEAKDAWQKARAYCDALADTKQTLCMAPLYAEYCALLFSLSNYNKV